MAAVALSGSGVCHAISRTLRTPLQVQSRDASLGFAGSSLTSGAKVIVGKGRVLVSLPSRNQFQIVRAGEGRKVDQPSEPQRSEHGMNGHKMATALVSLAAAGAVLLAPAGDALAAKGGGRVGGSAFRSAPSQESAPRVNNSRTNIYVAPGAAPPIYGGGYGGYYGAPAYGGYGWSPFSSFSYGPSIVVGGGGFLSFIFFIFIAGFVLNAIRGFFNRDDEI
eukprot:jgi/Mesen1/5073/ME000252S04185